MFDFSKINGPDCEVLECNQRNFVYSENENAQYDLIDYDMLNDKVISIESIKDNKINREIQTNQLKMYSKEKGTFKLK